MAKGEVVMLHCVSHRAHECDVVDVGIGDVEEIFHARCYVV